VAIPLLALFTHALRGGVGQWWRDVTQPEALRAIGLTLTCALLATVLNVVMGLCTAWVLVRENFKGKALLNAIIDIPFALPTVVAGVTFMTLYGPLSPLQVNLAGTWMGIVVALLFVTLPFCVRTVQPVLETMSWTAEAASTSLGARGWYTFVKITMPALLPSVVTGAGLAFARAIGEFGSVVFISGNRPFHTEVASSYIFMLTQSQNFDAAASVSLALMLLALCSITIMSLVSRRWTGGVGA
jgi:sulfate transport system permease protein